MWGGKCVGDEPTQNSFVYHSKEFTFILKQWVGSQNKQKGKSISGGLGCDEPCLPRKMTAESGRAQEGTGGE